MLLCLNKKMKVREHNDYKSIALPVELQGHRLFCRVNSLFIQVIQHKINPYLARSCRCSQSPVLTCGPFVTNKSVFKSVFKSWKVWDFKLLSNFIKTNQWSGNYETNKIYKNKYRKITASYR